MSLIVEHGSSGEGRPTDSGDRQWCPAPGWSNGSAPITAGRCGNDRRVEPRAIGLVPHGSAAIGTDAAGLAAGFWVDAGTVTLPGHTALVLAPEGD